MAIQGGPPLPGWGRSLEELLQFRMGLTEKDAAWSVDTTPTDRETYAVVSGVFKRNLIGWPTCKSQFGYEYMDFGTQCPVAFEEALGTSRAMDILRQEARKGAEVLSIRYPVAVWRCYPEIKRSEQDGQLNLCMRLHVMTEERYQQFVQTEKD